MERNEELFLRYEDTCYFNKSPQTIKLMRCILRKFDNFIQKPIREVTRDDVIAFLKQLQKENMKPLTLEMYKSNIKKFFKFYYNWEDGDKVPDETVQQIISRKLEDFTATLGIAIESSSFVHGDFDWIITFTARDIIHAKEFVDALLKLNPGIIKNITIMQTMMFIRKQYILNPEREKLRNFL
jgi:hypothetical protein